MLNIYDSGSGHLQRSSEQFQSLLKGYLWSGILHPKIIILSFSLGWEPGGLLLSHWLPSKLHCKSPEKNEKHRQKSAISGSIITLWSNDNTFCKKKKKKKKDFIQHLGQHLGPDSSMSLFQRSAILEIIPWTQNAYTLLTFRRLKLWKTQMTKIWLRLLSVFVSR